MKQLILIAILATTAGLARAEQQCYFTLTADPESAMPSYLGQGMLVTKAGQAVVQRMG